MCISIEKYFLKSLHGGHPQWSKQNQKKPYSHVKEERKKEKLHPSVKRLMNESGWVEQDNILHKVSLLKPEPDIFPSSPLTKSKSIYNR